MSRTSCSRRVGRVGRDKRKKAMLGIQKKASFLKKNRALSAGRPFRLLVASRRRHARIIVAARHDGGRATGASNEARVKSRAAISPSAKMQFAREREGRSHLQEAVDATDGELKAGFDGARGGLLLVALLVGHGALGPLAGEALAGEALSALA